MAQTAATGRVGPNYGRPTLTLDRVPSGASHIARIVGVLSGLWLATAPAVALEERPADWDANKACEQKVCTLILERKPVGEEMSCKLAKTWPKTTLQGGEGKLVKWGFGDARCAVELNLSRSVLLTALSAPTYQLDIPRHDVKCVVESDGQMKPVEVSLAPRIDFKNGKADKVWINLQKATGPTSITATVKTAAGLEDSLGIFHRSMIKAVNKFVHRQCAERYGPDAEAFAREKEERRAARRRARGEPDSEPTAKSEVKREEARASPRSAPVSPSSAPPTEAAKEPRPPTTAPTASAAPPPLPSPIPPPPGARPSPADAAKREAARSSEANKPKPGPVRLELRTTTPWDVAPPDSKSK